MSASMPMPTLTSAAAPVEEESLLELVAEPEEVASVPEAEDDEVMDPVTVAVPEVMLPDDSSFELASLPATAPALVLLVGIEAPDEAELPDDAALVMDVAAIDDTCIVTPSALQRPSETSAFSVYMSVEQCLCRSYERLTRLVSG